VGGWGSRTAVVKEGRGRRKLSAAGGSHLERPSDGADGEATVGQLECWWRREVIKRKREVGAGPWQGACKVFAQILGPKHTVHL
jgi:hypothetical protein